METLVHSLAARVGALEAENAALREQAGEQVEAMPAFVSRRQWLARGAAVAVGAVAGSAAVVASPAAAATGPINMNEVNTANNATKLQLDFGNFGTAILQAWNLNASIGGGFQGLGAEFGVQGFSSVGEGGWFEGSHADIRLGGTRTLPPTTDGSVAHTRGEIAFVEGLSNSGEFWACVQTGQPGRWRKFAGFNLAGGLVVLSSPIRVYDSRPAQAPPVGTKSPLANSVDRTVDITANSSGVPSDATAVVINLTALKSNGTGWLSARSPVVSYANTSNLNFTTNAVVANLCVVSCSLGDIVVRLGGTASACDVIVDVVGYFR